MPIQLIDIPQAVADYLNSEVLTFVEDFDGTLSPGEDKQGGVLVLNGATTTALRLINLRLQLQIEPRPGGDPDPDDPDAAENARKVARLIAPAGPGLQCTDNEGNVIRGGDQSKKRPADHQVPGQPVDPGSQPGPGPAGERALHGARRCQRHVPCPRRR